jgi:hypothetical protein
MDITPFQPAEDIIGINRRFCSRSIESMMEKIKNAEK